MTECYKDRTEAAEERTQPSIWNSRYYVFRVLNKAIVKHIKKLQSPESTLKIIDFGCAKMPYRYLFEENQNSYVGADLPGNPHADIEIDPTGRIPVDDSSVDLVMSTQVLEHVKNVDSYLSEACRMTKNGGRLLLSTHGYWMFHPDPGDYHRWTSQGLRELIESYGYEIERWDGILGLPATGLHLFQDGILQLLRRRYLKPIKWFAVPIFQFLIILIDKISSEEGRRLDSSVYVLTAVKNNS